MKLEHLSRTHTLPCHLGTLPPCAELTHVNESIDECYTHTSITEHRTHLTQATRVAETIPLTGVCINNGVNFIVCSRTSGVRQQPALI